MRVIVTGSRKWIERHPIAVALNELPLRSTIVHGGCRGFDQTAAEIAHAMMFTVEEFPANWNTHGKAAGPIRNQAMVDAGADLVLAFPTEQSKGTWDCVRRAEKAGIPVRVILGANE